MIRRTLIFLTIQYSILLLGLFAIFSSSVYVYMVHTFDTDYNQTVSEDAHKYKANSAAAEKQGAEETTDAGIARLRKSLIIGYGSLVVVVPFISYGLARRNLKPIIRSYNAQQQFVDNASHELRTPLSRIQGELELALSTKRSVSDYQKAIGTSLKETEGMVKMISNLLLLARGTSKEVAGSLQDVKLQAYVSSAIESLHTTYANSTPRIVNRMRRKPIIITIMPELFEHALINILDNSVKFTPTTGIITINAKIDASNVVFSIADNGRGMNSDEMEHAFDRFWRAQDSQSVIGHGLGLPFAKQVIEAHHGEVSIEANRGQGIIVTITLPVSSA